VPCLIRWPGVFPAGKVLNGIVSHADWFVTFLAAAGRPGIDEELKKGAQVGSRSYKVHLDGYNQLDYLMGAWRVEGGERRRRKRDETKRTAHEEVNVCGPLHKTPFTAPAPNSHPTPPPPPPPQTQNSLTMIG